MRLSDLLRPASTSPIKVLDLCTGSGCVPLLLCYLWPPGSTHAVGVDVAGEAVQLAHENAVRCGVSVRDTSDFDDGTHSMRNTVTFLQADILRADFSSKLERSLLPPFDIVTANPPYIPRGEYDQLPSSVKDYEDSRALLGDPVDSTYGRGLTFYESITGLIGQQVLLKDGGIVVLEVGHNQSNDVRELMISRARLRRTEVWRDPWDKERVVVGWR